jgi:hypothetical protein
MKNGRKVFKVERKDYKEAIEYFNMSIKEKEPDHVKASIEANKILLKRINFKDRKTDDYLLKLLRRDVGIGIEKYKKFIKSYMEVGKEAKNCRLTLQYSDFKENGYLNIYKKASKIENKNNYKKTIETCKGKSFETMIAKSALNRL